MSATAIQPRPAQLHVLGHYTVSDEARAAGCLIKHRIDHDGWVSIIGYLCDAEFAADLAVRVIERTEHPLHQSQRRRAGSGLAPPCFSRWPMKSRTCFLLAV